MKNVSLVVFDLDGVIADTEPLHKASKQELLDELGVNPDMDMVRFIGRPNADFWREIMTENGLSLSIAEMERRQYEGILRMMRENGTPMSAGLADLLDVLAARNIRCAVCSSSDRFYVEGVLAFYGLSDRFVALVAGDDVPRKKPAPDGYLRVTELAGVSADGSVAIEDSAAGVAAAAAAGLRVVAYRNPTSGNQDLSRANSVVNGLSEVSDAMASL